jgi:hypothetical protein
MNYKGPRIFGSCECETLKCPHHTWNPPSGLSSDMRHIVKSWILSDMFDDTEDGIDKLNALGHTPEWSNYPWTWMDITIITLFDWVNNKTQENMDTFIIHFQSYGDSYNMSPELNVIREKSLNIVQHKLDVIKDQLADAFTANNIQQIRTIMNIYFEEFCGIFRYNIPLYYITEEFDVL